MNNLVANCERILEVLRKISNENLLSYLKTSPKGFGIHSLALTAEFIGINSENPLFRHIRDAIR